MLKKCSIDRVEMVVVAVGSRRSSSSSRSRGSGRSGSSVSRFLVLVVSTGCSGRAECLRKQWLVVAHYFHSFSLSDFNL